MKAVLAAALVAAAGFAAAPAAAERPDVGVVVLSPDVGDLASDGRRVVVRLANEGWFSSAPPSQATKAYEGCFRPGEDEYQREWDEACVRAVLDAAPTDGPQVVMVFETTRSASAAARVTCLGRGSSRVQRELVHVHDALGEHPAAGPHARAATGRCLLAAVYGGSPPAPETPRW